MFMMAIMLIMWQGSGQPKYQGPFIKTVEATYAGSDVKGYAEELGDRTRKKYPTLTAIGITGYAVGVKKQAQFTSKKFSLVPDTVTTYQYDYRAKSGSVGITWHY